MWRCKTEQSQTRDLSFVDYKPDEDMARSSNGDSFCDLGGRVKNRGSLEPGSKGKHAGMPLRVGSSVVPADGIDKLRRRVLSGINSVSSTGHIGRLGAMV